MDDDKQTVSTVPISEASFARGSRVYDELNGRPPVSDPITKIMLDEQEKTKRFRLVAEGAQVLTGGEVLRKFALDVEQKRGLLTFESPHLNATVKALDAFRDATVKHSMAGLVDRQNMVASQMLKGFSDSIAPILTRDVAAGLNLPSVGQLLRPGVISQITSVSAWVTDWDHQRRVITPTTRAVTPTMTTPVRRRGEVRRFLRNLHPALIQMLDGVYEVLHTSNGTGASAYSATELMKLMTFTLVPQADVNRYVAQHHGGDRRRHHVFELMAITYNVDASILMTLTNTGQLSGSFEWIKHHWHEIDPVDAQTQLDALVDELEDLLVFLAQSIKRRS